MGRKPTSPKTPNATLSQQLDNIRELLGRAPDKRSPMRPTAPRTMASIANLLGQSIEGDLKTFLNACGNAGAALTFAEGQDWLDATEIVSALRMLRSGGDFPLTLVPISTDTAGNYSCIDIRTNRVRDWDHETRKAAALAPNLQAWLRKDVERLAKQAIADAEAIAGLQSNAPKAFQTGEASAERFSPTKLRRVSRPDFTKIDRESYAGGSRALAVLSDERIVIGFQNWTPIWDLAKAAESHTLRISSSAIAAHQPSQRVIAADFTTLNLIDARDGQIVTTWEAHPDRIWCVDIHPSAGVAVSSGAEGIVRLWDIDKPKNLPQGPPTLGRPAKPGKPIGAFAGHKDIVTFCVFSPDGTRLLTGGWDHTIRIWDVAKRKERARWKAPMKVTCGAFAPDGANVAVGLNGGEVILLDMKGKVTARWEAHSYDVRGVAFASPERLVSATSNEIRLWDVMTRKALATEKVAKGNLRGIRVHGRALYTAGPLGLWTLE